MDKIIHCDQTGFIKGRFIGENIRLVYDIMHYTEIIQVPGLLMLIDFEKAFDTVSWNFIQDALHFFNFGDSIKSWIYTFYNDIKSCVIQNGVVSDYFYPERGCRQGDPISPYLFLLCAEILGILIRNNKDIKGITIEGVEYKLSQYADDTTIFTDGSPSSLDGIIRILDYFATLSGLKINPSKTKMIWIGSKKFSKDVFHHSRWKFEWNNKTFNLLGVEFTINLSDMLEINYKYKVEEIKRIMKHWEKRNLTPFGRLTVIKTLLIPKLNHLICTIPNPSQSMINSLEKDFYNFLWKSKRHKIKKNVAIQDYEDGGLKMINYADFITALKSSWVRRLLHSNAKWKNLLEVQLGFKMELFWIYGIDFIEKTSENISNPFWSEVFQSWSAIYKVDKSKTPSHEPLWYNPKITVGGNSVLYKNYQNSQVIFINDLISEDGSFLSYDYIRNSLKVKTNFLEYTGLKKAISKNQEFTKNQLIKYASPFIPSTISIFFKNKKGCKDMYKTLVKSKLTNVTAISKWSNYGINFSKTDWKNIFILPFRTTTETKLQWLQLQIIHRIIPCNNFLFKIKVTDSPTCSFCKEDLETIEHLFADCHIVKELWSNIEEWISNKFDRHISFDRKSILFGKFGNQNIYKCDNLIILTIKQYIYTGKYLYQMKNCKLSVETLKNVLIEKIRIQKLLLLKNCRYDEYHRFWQTFYDKL